MQFEWNDRKAAGNLREHGVSFEEASTVFSDDHALTGADPDNSIGGNRWITFGVSGRKRLLVVSHAEEGDNYPHHQCSAGNPA